MSLLSSVGEGGGRRLGCVRRPAGEGPPDFAELATGVSRRVRLLGGNPDVEGSFSESNDLSRNGAVRATFGRRPHHLSSALLEFTPRRPFDSATQTGRRGPVSC